MRALQTAFRWWPPLGSAGGIGAHTDLAGPTDPGPLPGGERCYCAGRTGGPSPERGEAAAWVFTYLHGGWGQESECLTAIPVSYRWSTLFILQRLKIAADSAVVELARSCIIEMFLKLPFLLLPITFGPYLAVWGGVHFASSLWWG